MSRLFVALVLAAAGAILFGQGIYIHAKAMLAQVLLERAFAETITSGRAVKPWPWADTWPEARITVKRLGASAIALAGSSGQALAFGPGHVERTADAGERGVAVYSAHRDTHFRFLRDVGDRRRDRRHTSGWKNLPLPRRRLVDRALRSIGHRSVHDRPRTRSHDVLAVRRDRARTDALRAARDDGFAGDADGAIPAP